MPILRRIPDWIGIGQMQDPLIEASALPSWIRPVWSTTSLTGGAIGGSSLVLAPRYWAFKPTGGSGHFRIEGITKDATGAPLAGVTVMAIRTDADVAKSRPANVQEGTIGISDADGNYQVMVPTTDNYQVRAYLAGSPDVAGVSVNTLVGI